jgi:hypothetical protein
MMGREFRLKYSDGRVYSIPTEQVCNEGRLNCIICQERYHMRQETMTELKIWNLAVGHLSRRRKLIIHF